MIKKLTSLLIVFSFLITFSGLFIVFKTAKVYAMAERKQPRQAPRPIAPRKSRTEKLEEQLKLEKSQIANERLGAQEWVIYLTPKEAKRKPTIETDILIFAEGKLTTKNLSAQGYTTSNCRVDIDDLGTITWETMQVNEEIGLVFLRGELKEEVMTGAVIRQPKEGKKQTFYYSTLMPQIE
jgi:hypothetical protein